VADNVGRQQWEGGLEVDVITRDEKKNQNQNQKQQQHGKHQDAEAHTSSHMGVMGLLLIAYSTRNTTRYEPSRLSTMIDTALHTRTQYSHDEKVTISLLFAPGSSVHTITGKIFLSAQHSLVPPR